MSKSKTINSLLWLLGGAVPRTKEELDKLLEDTHKHTQLLPSGEILMLRNVLNLSNLKVDDVMIPYGKVDWLQIDNTLEEILAKAAKTGHSRYPVENKEGKTIEGVLHVKRLLGIKAEAHTKILSEQRNLLQKSHLVPEGKRLDAMLREFQHYRLHMMVVADEAGHPSGVVTIEDVLEKIVGQIHDEFDPTEGTNATIQPTSTPNYWKLAGETSLEEFNKFFNTKLDEERCDTIGGWIASELGHLPKINESVTLNDLDLSVTLVDQRRVLAVDVKRVEKSEAS